MNVTHEVGLSSTEIAWLWSVYINESMSICLIKHLQKYNGHKDVEVLLQRTMDLSEKHMEEIKNIFSKENFPIPRGFSENDVDLTAPALFFDLFSVSYVYGMSRVGLVTYGKIVSNVAREDVRLFFTKCLQSTLELYNISIELMLHKGIYDRPPMIPYPDHIEFIRNKETFISKWLEKQRPLNVIEISEMFFNIERNYFGLLLLTGLIQVAKDEKVKQHLVKGKQLAQKQIEFLNKTFINDDLLGTIMVNSEVTTSTVSPFSDRLIMFLITTLNTQGAAYIGHALSTSSRVDLVSEYSKLIPEIMKYGKEGMDIMIEYEWLEEPPHAPDRRGLARI
ncbi:DUF3231 family protein [Paenibacillus sp. GCM10023248]|uniref:DUF3231 family protein n=1 Tax=Bacillales TaxID=1385 RepID=UPI0023792C83|nr:MULTISPECIES: DUF3231 family protein [Bacillales]MDD9269544.1 DUF3231 family protein [Paenibacillus sp. MAHUQ-63]MDR6880839.1 hypothetical protein [Bacillus sp. 3255]